MIREEDGSRELCVCSGTAWEEKAEAVDATDICLALVTSEKSYVTAVAYPGGFSGCLETPPGHDFF